MATEVSLKKANEATGELKIIRAAELAKNGTVGTVAQGTYEGAKPNKFNPANNDYFIRGGDDTLYIINSTQALKEQMEQLAGQEGKAQVRVEYAGKAKTKNGKGFHQFEVFVTR